jgi:hypothetical protein
MTMMIVPTMRLKYAVFSSIEAIWAACVLQSVMGGGV